MTDASYEICVVCGKHGEYWDEGWFCYTHAAERWQPLPAEGAALIRSSRDYDARTATFVFDDGTELTARLASTDDELCSSPPVSGCPAVSASEGKTL